MGSACAERLLCRRQIQPRNVPDDPVQVGVWGAPATTVERL
jgi:hypothetical protein